MVMRHIAIWGLSGCTLFHLINGTIFVQKYTEHKQVCYDFLYNFCLNNFSYYEEISDI
jgi:hypothetical protein